MFRLAALAVCIATAAWGVWRACEGAATARRVDQLLADLQSGEATVVEAAVEELSGFRGENAIQRIVNGYASAGDQSVHITDVLKRIGPPAIPALVKTLRRRTSDWIRQMLPSKGLDRDANLQAIQVGAMSVLGSFGKDGVAPIVDAFRDPSFPLRNYALLVLARTKEPSAYETLAAGLADADWEVRTSAATGLGDFGDTRAVDLLAAALGDANRSVAVEAARSLGRLGDRRAVEPLLKALESPEVTVRAFTAEALGRLGDLRAADALARLLETDFDYVGRRAALALEYMGTEATRGAIDRHLKGIDLRLVAEEYAAFIREGAGATEWFLIVALERHGDMEMAADYKWCGNPALEEAARCWAQRRGVEEQLDSSADSDNRPVWGESELRGDEPEPPR